MTALKDTGTGIVHNVGTKQTTMHSANWIGRSTRGGEWHPMSPRCDRAYRPEGWTDGFTQTAPRCPDCYT